MKKNNSLPDNGSLRQKAEAKLKDLPQQSLSFANESDMLKLIHELQVHKLELEIQNEELLNANTAARETTELYDSTPKSEEQLRLELARLRRFVDSDIVGIVIADTSGKIIETNDYYLNIIGYSRDDLESGKVNWREITPPEWLAADETAIKELYEKGKCTPYEKEYIRKDGSRVVVLITDAWLPGTDEQIVGIILDITERKRNEVSLHESVHKYRELIENSPDAIIIYSKNEILLVNKECLHLMQVDTADDLLGKPVLQFVHPDSSKEVITRMKKMSGDGIVLPVNEERFIRPNGSEVDVEVKAVPVKFENKPAVQLIIRDITQRKQVDKKLKESKERLSKTQQMAHLGSWELDVETGRLIWSDEVYRILGLKPQEFDVTLDAFIEMMHPDDRELVRKAYFSSVNEGKDGYEIEHRVIRKLTGEVRYVYEKCEHICDNSNKIIRSIGMVHDITERKLVESELIRKDKLLEITGSTAKVGGWEFDVESLKLLWTEEVYLIHELDLTFIPTLKIEIGFYAPDSQPIIENAIQRAIEFGEDYDLELEFITAKDNHRWVKTIGKCIRQNENTKKVYGSFQDITERKQMEIALRESEAHFRILTEDVTDVVWKQDSNNRFTYISPADERLRGFRADEVIGHHVFELLTDEGIELVKEKTMKRFTSNRHGATDDTLTFEVQQRCKNGKWIWTEVVSTAEYGSEGTITGHHGISRDITERRNAEEALRKSEERYRFMYANSPQPMYIFDLETLAFIEVNQAMVNHYGYSREEFLHMTIKDIRPPEDVAALIDDIEKARHSSNVRGEWKHIKKNGEPILVEIASQPLNYNGRDALHILINDITERQRAQEELKASEAKFRDLFESNTDGIAIFPVFWEETSANFIDLNENAAKMLGYTKDEMLHLTIDDIESKRMPVNTLKRKQELLANGFSVFESKILHKGGHEIDVEIKVMLINYNNQPALMSIVRDITQRKNAEIQLHEYAVELSKQVAEKNKFFSIIAHDLRSPFNGFLGLSQLMAEKLPELSMTEVHEMAVSMNKSATNLFRLLENLLHWARIEQGLIPFNPVVVNLHSIVTESMAISLESAKNKGIGLTNLIPHTIEIFADTNMLQTIIRNLVSNAVKYTPAGGEILLAARVAIDKSVEISVQDSGIGMSAGILENLFHLNVKANRKGTAGEPSTGLGLIICKEFIEKHGGKLHVESEVNIGSTFRFNIPNSKPMEELTDNAAAELKADESQQENKLKILIAEDDETSGMLISIALRAMSREIFKVDSGQEAIEVCRNNPDIDLIMMDIKMPGMDGYEATRQIRQFNEKVVIIAQSAYGEAGDLDLAFQTGFNEYIMKPLSVPILRELVQGYFKV